MTDVNVTSAAVEVLRSAPSDVRLTTAAVEVLRSASVDFPIMATSAAIEVLRSNPLVTNRRPIVVVVSS